MPPQKGKRPTKGAKQIVEENHATMKLYRNMSLGAGFFHILVNVGLFYETLSARFIYMNVLQIIIYVASYQMMKFMSKPIYNNENVLLDSGLDLSMEDGIGEHVKDIVILASITHVATVISDYFWLLLLLLPVRAMWLIWTNILGPWFFEEAPQDTESDEKKKKKMERKFRKAQ